MHYEKVHNFGEEPSEEAGVEAMRFDDDGGSLASARSEGAEHAPTSLSDTTRPHLTEPDPLEVMDWEGPPPQSRDRDNGYPQAA